MEWFDNYPEELKERITNGEIIDQKYWSFIKELNSYSDERLDSTAFIVGEKKISYRKMFEKWERFAEIFSALDITEAKNARIGLMTTLSLDCISIIYSANMTGADVSMIHPVDVIDEEHFEALVEKEGITDVIFASDVTKPEVLRRVIASKKKLSLNNVIVYHCGVARGNRKQRHEDHRLNALKRVEGALFLDDLRKEYKGTPIQFASEGSKEGAIVFRTSGTTSGFHKPVPLSDSAFNESAARLLRDERFRNLSALVTMMAMEPMVSYAGCDMMHAPLSYGGTIVLAEGGFSPSMLKLIEENKVTVVFAGSRMFEPLLKFPIRPDLSNVEVVFLGGSYISKSTKKRYMKYLRDCGSKAEIYVGYGLTEIGGAALLTDKNTEDDCLGKPLSGVKVKILDEENNTFYDPEDGARMGVLCLSSKSLSSGQLNDMKLFDLIDIDGEKYLNTYDLVDINENGDMRVIGRMNKFFVNNDGVRFDAGLVETAISGEPGIEDCGLVPEYTKLIHDTIPVLYVKTLEKGRKGRTIVKNALYNVFVKNGRIVDSNLPTRAVIVEDLPYTPTGKVDVHRILKEKYTGDAFRIDPVKRHGKLVDVILREYDREKAPLPGGVPDELTEDLKLLMEVKDLSKGRLGPAIRSRGFEKKAVSGMKTMQKGLMPEMIFELIMDEDVKPEALGRMLARMLIDREKQEIKRRAKRRKKRRDDLRGCL